MPFMLAIGVCARVQFVRVYDNNVICLFTGTVEYNRTKVPIIKTEMRSKKVWIGGIVPKWGNMGKTTIQYPVEVHAGNTVTKFMRLEKRVVQTLGSGQVVAGDWTKVREWTEVEKTA